MSKPVLTENTEKVSIASKSNTDSFDWVKYISGIFVGVTGITYACGFFIDSLHLSRYGIYDFSIINSGFIYTGFTFLILCFISLVGSLWLEIIVNSTDRGIFVRAVTLFVALQVFSAVFSLLCKSIISFVDGTSAYFQFPITCWFDIAILAFTFQIFAVKKIPLSFPFLSLLSSSFVLLVMLASLYAFLYYPLLPVSLSGGRPEPIRLVIKSDGIPSLQQLFKINGDNQSEVIYLLEKSTQTYYILVESDEEVKSYQPVEIDKSLIIGVLHPYQVMLPNFLLENRQEEVPSQEISEESTSMTEENKFNNKEDLLEISQPEK